MWVKPRWGHAAGASGPAAAPCSGAGSAVELDVVLEVDQLDQVELPLDEVDMFFLGIENSPEQVA